MQRRLNPLSGPWIKWFIILYSFPLGVPEGRVTGIVMWRISCRAMLTLTTSKLLDIPK
jgi:hypothetical protein